MGATTKTVGGSPATQQGQNFNQFLDQLITGSGIGNIGNPQARTGRGMQGLSLGNIGNFARQFRQGQGGGGTGGVLPQFVNDLFSGEGGISQQILAGIGDVGFDLDSEFGQAFTQEQDVRRNAALANLNARFGAAGPGGAGGGLAFGTGAARLNADLEGNLLRQDALAIGELDQRARGFDLAALSQLFGQQTGFASNLFGLAGQAAGFATPQAQTIQVPSFAQELLKVGASAAAFI